ncbi:hypothetical protein J4219_08020 [Candidatus Woesearchaeota archaeon]|nr:hypothetical protein [Candidatus Woesearchaeota archaeon]
MNGQNFQLLKRLSAAIATISLCACAYPRVSGPYTFNNVQPVHTTRSTDESAIESTLEELERIPDNIQRIGNNYGRIVLFAGRLTDQPEFEQHTGQRHETAGSWNSIDGCYNRQSRQAFISIYPPPRHSESVELHEYGHMIDQALGFESNKTSFKRIFEQYRDETIFGIQYMQLHQASRTEEFFATCFARYYHSDFSRERLQRNYPEAAEYFERLDERLNSCGRFYVVNGQDDK